jgi:hypothetical protein
MDDGRLTPQLAQVTARCGLQGVWLMITVWVFDTKRFTRPPHGQRGANRNIQPEVNGTSHVATRPGRPIDDEGRWPGRLRGKVAGGRSTAPKAKCRD